MDPEQLLALAVAFTGTVVTITLARAWAHRIRGRGMAADTALAVDDLRNRVAAMEHELDRLDELEERVEFAERVLTEARDMAKGLSSRGDTLTGEPTDP